VCIWAFGTWRTDIGKLLCHVPMKLHTVKSRAHGKLAFSGSVPIEIIFIYQKRKVELQQKYLLHTSSLNKQEREEHKNTINLNI